MEAIRVLAASLSMRELLKGLAIATVLSRFLPSRSTKDDKTTTSSRHWNCEFWRAEILKISGFFSLFVFARSWLGLVDYYVPEPYLDEVFHIPQAQTYCEGRFRDWDDKITTPPGLYLLSVAYHRFWMLAECTPFSLRNNNLLAVLLTALLAALCRGQIEARTREREADRKDDDPSSLVCSRGPSLSLYAYHTGINIALFPVLFFFSGLYYTDVVSTLLVLVAYRNHLGRMGHVRPGVLNDLWTVILGTATLFMRQTNVFWVVVFMGGAEAVHAVRSRRPKSEERRPRQPDSTTLEEQARFHIGRWAVGDIDDPPVDIAWPDDWLVCLLSIAVGVICNPVKVLRQVWPHMTILSLFAGFVAWNGGVVLGDKSNHVATIHLAQMLYIWPLFAFFSAPLFLRTILELLTFPSRALYTLLCANPASTPPDQKSKSNVTTLRKVYHPVYLLSTVGISLAIVRFNTIIHPFTLADNRHYMFYIFRYTIRRSFRIRYLLVAGYTLCRWLVWRRLAGYRPTTTTQSKVHLLNPSSSSSTSTTVPSSSFPPLTSTVLFWFLTTSLSLITAPLVEPRYFILPWVFFRLLVPPVWRHVQLSSSPSSSSSSKPAGKDTSSQKEKVASGVMRKTRERQVDFSLVLETLWFVAINLGTMYIFLYRPFYWRGVAEEDGNEILLDGGRVQRFMW